ncbi:hypothetical protein GUJ93_ZPchr0002g23968 [Zizania palustris]|uniref:RING-type E3 ubiquitin transferase n=1 Tax=Zizania palustris TaxID=103762 RepID=A0A8J5RYB7_ZIZPA|nr:hypothetical protein GUJ93_ZPchr0002g23968 [Zizania palustris]
MLPSCRARMHSPGRYGQPALLAAALVACALASSAGAQPAAPRGYSYGNVSGQQVHVSAIMIVLLAAVLAVFLFIAFATIFLFHCTGGYTEREGDASRFVPADSLDLRRQQRRRGLESSVLRMFPTMKYAEAKALRLGKVAGALECAVCLSEFEDDEMLMFLPKCSHAFHPDCIGEWLASHVTCPVCRCNLDPTKDTTEELEVIVPAAARETNSTSSEIAVVRQEDDGHQAAVVIDVVTEVERRKEERMELQAIGTQLRAMRMRSRSGLRPVAAPAKFVRSHSTGHSLYVRLDSDLERFTLRLPEHVHREMVAAGEQSVRHGRRVGEGSSRRGRSFPRLSPSGRWPSFLPSPRFFSGKLPFFSASRRTPDITEEGDVVPSSSSPSPTKVKAKRVAAVDAADCPAQGTAAGSAAADDVEKAATRQVRTYRRNTSFEWRNLR